MNDNTDSAKTKTAVIVAVITVIGGCIAATIGLGQPVVSRLVDIYFPVVTPTSVIPSSPTTLPILPNASPEISNSGFATITDTPISEILTDTPTNINTVTPTSTNIPGLPLVAPADLDVRVGPSSESYSVGVLLSGENTEIIGRSQDSKWWQIRFPPDTYGQGWVYADPIFSIVVNLENVPIGTPFYINSPIAYTDEELTLNWSEYPGASYYEVTLFRVLPSFQEIFVEKIGAPTYTILRNQLETDARYSYSVKVFDANDKLIMEGTLFNTNFGGS